MKSQKRIKVLGSLGNCIGDLTFMGMVGTDYWYIKLKSFVVAIDRIISFADKRLSKSLLKPEILVNSKCDLQRQYPQRYIFAFLSGHCRQMNLSFHF